VRGEDVVDVEKSDKLSIEIEKCVLSLLFFCSSAKSLLLLLCGKGGIRVNEHMGISTEADWTGF